MIRTPAFASASSAAWGLSHHADAAMSALAECVGLDLALYGASVLSKHDLRAPGVFHKCESIDV